MRVRLSPPLSIKHQVGFGKRGFHLLDGRQVHAGILAHSGVRTRPGFDSQDAFLQQDALERPLHVLGVFRRNHVVGDDQHA